MSFSVAVSGATGYAGGEVLRVAAGHPELDVRTVTANSNAGSLLGEHQPHLRQYAGMQLLDTTADNLAGHDVIFLALPHGASGTIAAELESISPDSLIVDLGADHRLVDAASWQKFYGTDHPGSWAYGLPELVLPTGKQRDKLDGTRRLAVPGCNVTAVTLALAPLLAAKVIDPVDLVAVLANGPSGAGKSAKTHLLASEILGAASPYGVGGVHRHQPEIEQNLNWSLGADPASGPVRMSFTPTLVPMARGILATISAKITSGLHGGGTARDTLRSALDTAYGDEPFVSVLPDGQWPSTAWTLGANSALIQLAVDERAGRVVVTSAIDNLVKGTAGGAIQSVNIALGLPETTGLTTQGVAP